MTKLERKAWEVIRTYRDIFTRNPDSLLARDAMTKAINALSLTLQRKAK